MAKARSLQEYVPEYVTEHASKVLETIAEAMPIGTDAVGNSAGDMDHIMDLLANAQDEGNAAATRLKFQTDEADSFKQSRSSR